MNPDNPTTRVATGSPPMPFLDFTRGGGRAALLWHSRPNLPALGLASLFQDRFGSQPTLLVRAPGRVNLMGEHIDYAHCPVLPFAIDRGVDVAAAPTESGGVTAHSLQYPKEGTWRRYLDAAVVVSRFQGHASLLVGGNLPPEGGLSSSSALTLALLQALFALAGERPGADDLVRLAVRAERIAAVAGGEMDQTVITRARAGHALHIRFHPSSLTPIPLPPGFSFVVGWSGQPSPKGGASKDLYHRMVVSARTAAALAAVAVGEDAGNPPAIGRLSAFSPSNLPVETTPGDAADMTGVPLEALVGVGKGALSADTALPVRAMACHIQTESLRVSEAVDALKSGHGEALGTLMDASHASLCGLGVATTGLDRVVSSMRRAGAWGARLTGAGFGGFALSVASPDISSAVAREATKATGGPAFVVEAVDGIFPL